MKKSEKVDCLLFFYNSIYSDYKKFLRIRSLPKVARLGISAYKKELNNLQEIITKDYNPKCNFPKL
jgi:hypothetical protein